MELRIMMDWLLMNKYERRKIKELNWDASVSCYYKEIIYGYRIETVRDEEYGDWLFSDWFFYHNDGIIRNK